MNEFESFLNHLEKERRLSPHTLVGYRKDLGQFASFLQSIEAPNESCGKDEVRLWVIQLMEDGLNPTSIQRKLSALSSYFQFEMQEGHRKDNPVKQVTLPKKQKRLPDFVPSCGVEQLLSELDWSESGFMESLIVLMLYGTGMRRSELIDLTWNSIQGDGSVRVVGKGNKERIIGLPQFLKVKIEEYRQLVHGKDTVDGVNWVFRTKAGKKVYPKFVYRVVNRYLSKAAKVNKKSPHVLRHSYATHLMENGADISSIQQILGHSSLNATQVYTHTSVDKLKHIHSSFHPRGKDTNTKK